ncbi:cell cycle checkpoint protein RAD1 [Thecamonas trahens ATCC 50062]|uniref:Cell cycle checkpoint protein RAD1 n=1 Tax=Thecamonas trahens ATCC 50062 TaxID=461836 RepID=A0A0L0D8D4_THETB|nr:cell cycle checkpoint protein RAD1 [Thecamonas trahens ATCC 50062]KNC48341.1 cell cycle checkpoint protein RAD1 [Thecamonas trahens ATCC 50062]|eukprot:XP_013758466.1 cell cycle checkpoint protein RAD1 [Thecamonas trahens ATCC 50062]
MAASSQPLQTISSPPVAVSRGSSGASLGEDENGEAAELYTETGEVNVIRDVLGTLDHVGKDSEVTLLLLENGIKLTVVNESKTVLANAFLQDKLFSKYAVAVGVRFTVSLTVLLECLTLFGTSSTGRPLRMIHARDGAPLVLELVEASVATRCAIATLVAAEPIELNFASPDVRGKAIIISSAVHDALYELEGVAGSIAFEFVPQTRAASAMFRMSARGSAGSCAIEFPHTSDGGGTSGGTAEVGPGAAALIESFDTVELITNEYKTELVHASLRALALASKTSIRVNTEGILSLQHMINRGDELIFVEFFVVPDEAYEPDAA